MRWLGNRFLETTLALVCYALFAAHNFYCNFYILRLDFSLQVFSIEGFFLSINSGQG
jgi:hypothetical protein